MGQAQSEVATIDRSHHSSSAGDESRPSSMEALIAEATAFGDNENEPPDARLQKALECPCVAGLRNGPCGTQFSEAFVCFIKSTEEEKVIFSREDDSCDTPCTTWQGLTAALYKKSHGSDCVHPFVALQNCIKANPDAFSKDVLDEDDSKREVKHTKEYRIIPPTWSKETNHKVHKSSSVTQ